MLGQGERIAVRATAGMSWLSPGVSGVYTPLPRSDSSSANTFLTSVGVSSIGGFSAPLKGTHIDLSLERRSSATTARGRDISDLRPPVQRQALIKRTITEAPTPQQMPGDPLLSYGPHMFDQRWGLHGANWPPRLHPAARAFTRDTNTHLHKLQAQIDAAPLDAAHRDSLRREQEEMGQQGKARALAVHQEETDKLQALQRQWEKERECLRNCGECWKGVGMGVGISACCPCLFVAVCGVATHDCIKNNCVPLGRMCARRRRGSRAHQQEMARQAWLQEQQRPRSAQRGAHGERQGQHSKEQGTQTEQRRTQTEQRRTQSEPQGAHSKQQGTYTERWGA